MEPSQNATRALNVAGLRHCCHAPTRFERVRLVAFHRNSFFGSLFWQRSTVLGMIRSCDYIFREDVCPLTVKVRDESYIRPDEG